VRPFEPVSGGNRGFRAEWLQTEFFYLTSFCQAFTIDGNRSLRRTHCAAQSTVASKAPRYRRVFRHS
jgi:hypothetical protein